MHYDWRLCGWIGMSTDLIRRDGKDMRPDWDISYHNSRCDLLFAGPLLGVIRCPWKLLDVVDMLWGPHVSSLDRIGWNR